MKKKVIIAVCLMVFIGAFAGNATGVTTTERSALLDLFNSTNGTLWENSTNWQGDAGTECTWYGVSCDENENVTALYLVENNLTGTLPSSLGDLSGLKSLTIASNPQLSGTIPSELGNLSGLEALELYDNGLTGAIPEELGNLSNLKILALYGNKLTGSVPESLGNLSYLTIFYLCCNQLTGTLPSSLGNLSYLVHLHIHSNQLSGTIPSSIGNLSLLTQLRLSDNQFAGSIPESLGNLTNLEELSLDNNQLTGTLPSSVGNLGKLTELSVYSNQLSGEIPREIGNLSNLRTLFICCNSFTGPIPATLGNLSNLVYFHAHENALSGTIPASLGNLSNLIELKLNSNQLSGPIPPELGNLSNLKELFLAYNKLNGPIPSQFGNLTNLETLYIVWSELTGQIPKELGNLKRLNGLFLHDNHLTGTIPRELGNLTGLSTLNVESNQLQGEIPVELKNLTNLKSEYTSFKWNALYTTDPSLKTFLDQVQDGGDWETHQTLPPSDLKTGEISGAAITVMWTPRKPIGDQGSGYEVWYAKQGQPEFTLAGITENESTHFFTVSGLLPQTPYSFKVRTKTFYNSTQNTLFSEFTAPVSAATNDSNNPPVSDAGPDQQVKKDQTVVLDATNSTDPEGNITSYRWTQIEGPQVPLTDPGRAKIEFKAPPINEEKVGLVFKLEVTDARGAKSEDTCQVTVYRDNLPPVADAGPFQNVKSGQKVILDGSNSRDPDGQIVSYRWSQISGPGVNLSDPGAARVEFNAPAIDKDAQIVSFELEVTDNAGSSAKAAVEVKIIKEAGSPVADAGGDQIAKAGQTVILDGSGSIDPDGSVVSYLWEQLSGTKIELSDPAAPKTSFVIPDQVISGETLEFRLTVTDDAGKISSATTRVTLFQTQLPVADAGADQTVKSGQTVTLDGSGSTDPDDGIASFKWIQIGGIQVNLNNAEQKIASFIAPEITDVGGKRALRQFVGEKLEFLLRVTDHGGGWAEDTCMITIIPDNLPAASPQVVNPKNEDFINTNSVMLKASAFFDPEGDTHIKSYWMITRADRKNYCPETDSPLIPFVETEAVTEHLVSGLVPGMKYMWKVGYLDSGSGIVSWSKEFAFKVGSPQNSGWRTLPFGTEYQHLKMVSVPIWLDQPSAEHLFGDIVRDRYGKDFRMGTYDIYHGATGGYIEYGPDLKIEPGMAFWFLSREEVGKDFFGLRVAADREIDVRLDYDPGTGTGWNMIGCPNNADYPWADVQIVVYNFECNLVFGPIPIGHLDPNNPYIDKRLWRWEWDRYESDTQWLDRNQGYWVRARTENVFLRFPVNAQHQPNTSGQKIAAAKLFRKYLHPALNNTISPSTASAGNNDSPPAPLGGFNSSGGIDLSVDSGGGGCFISNTVEH